MDWNNLYSTIASVKNKALAEINDNLLPKIESHKDFDKESGFLPMEEMEMLVDGEMQYVNGINSYGIIRIGEDTESDIYSLDVYDIIYLGDELERRLNGDK